MKRNIFLVLLIVLTMVVLGCSGNNEEKVESSASNHPYQNEKCHSIDLPENSEPKLHLELSFNLDDCGEFEPDDVIKSAKWFRYKDDKIYISVDHIVTVNDNIKLNFNMQTFMADFENPEQLNAKMKVLEDRYINGRKVTYAKSIIDENNNPQIIENIGIEIDGEYWTIMYTYLDNDKKMKRMVNKSIESIKIY